MELKPKKRIHKPQGKKGQVVFYSEQEKQALAHMGNGSVAEGTRSCEFVGRLISGVLDCASFDLNHVGICLFVDDDLADDL